MDSFELLVDDEGPLTPWEARLRAVEDESEALNMRIMQLEREVAILKGKFEDAPHFIQET